MWRGGRVFGAPRRVVYPIGLLAVLVMALGMAASLAAQEIDDVPRIRGGEWVRIANLRDEQGRFQPRQEHSSVELNGFVYLIGGFVPLQPPPEPTEENPEPFPFTGTDEVLAYVPSGHPAADGLQAGTWHSLSQRARFPQPDAHHIISVVHQGRIWSFGGHAGPFQPTDTVFVFTPDSPTSPEGSWSMVRVSDGQPCDPATETCLRLPSPRAAGSAVSFGNRIFVLGGVEPNLGARDPINESIRTTASILALDTTRFPLTWEVMPQMLESREHFNAVVFGGRIWAFNGRNEESTHMRGVESFAPAEASWRREPSSPIGTSANVLARVRECVYSFGGEFIASNITGTVINSQAFHLPTQTWRIVEPTFATEPLDAAGADSKHGTFGIAFAENGMTKIMAPGGAATAWFDPMSRVHVFTPPATCDQPATTG